MNRSVNPVQSDIKGMTVFNTKEVDTKKQPMFFGKPLGIQGHTQLQSLVDDIMKSEEEVCESCAI